MKNRARITVTSQMVGDDGSIEKVELVTEGMVYLKDGTTYISYDECAVTGMEGTKTLIKLTPGKIVISRFGNLKTQMIFVEGQQSVSYYDTQYGGFDVAINTLEAKVLIRDKYIHIQILYEIDFNGASTGQNNLVVEVQELDV